MAATERPAESIALEADYWKQVLAICAELSASIGAGSDELMRHNLTVLELTVGGRWPEAVLVLGESVNAAQARLLALMRIVASLGELAGGRVGPLFAEAGLEPPRNEP